MTKVLWLQVLAALLGAVVAGVLYGGRGAYFAILAGLICCAPNLLFASRLQRLKRNVDKTGTMYWPVFIFGTAFKWALTCGLLVLIRVLYPDLIWPAFLLGLVVTLQANLFAFLLKIN